jgi:hypothetical protein
LDLLVRVFPRVGSTYINPKAKSMDKTIFVFNFIACRRNSSMAGASESKRSVSKEKPDHSRSAS